MASFTKESARRIVDAVQYVENRFYPHKTGVASRSQRDVQSAIVTIKNKSGADRHKGEVLGLGDPVFDPANEDELDAFKGELVYDGEEYDRSDHGNYFVVLLEDIGGGENASDEECGEAMLMGVCQALINVTSASHTTAGPEDGEYKLQSGNTGAALVRKATGTGEKWSLVQLGGSTAGTALEHAILVGDVGAAIVTTSSAEPGLSGPTDARLVTPNDSGVFVPVTVDGSPVRLQAVWRGGVGLRASSDYPLWVSGYRMTLNGDEVFMITSESDLRGVPGFEPTGPQAIRHLAFTQNYAWGGQTCADPEE